MDAIESLLADVEQLGDAAAREKARELARAVLAFHREGLRVLLDRLDPAAREQAARDPAVGALLLLHGLHPAPLEKRAREALAGTGAEIVAVEGAVVRVRARAGEAAEIERLLCAAAPDADVSVEEIAPLLGVDRLVRRGGAATTATTATTEQGHETCELCGKPVGPTHDHLFEVESERLTCSCAPCALLFAGDTAGRRYTRVPAQVRRLADFPLDALDVPIGVVFFVKSTKRGRVVAMYPGPAGATESELTLDHPAFAELAPDVEALLVSRARGARAQLVVPIDACYALVGEIRRSWRGVSGGADAWRRIDAVFAELEARAS